MHSHIAAILSAATLAAAQYDNPLIHPQMKRALLEARQTLPSIPDLSPSCTSAILGVYESLPTPPAELITAVGAGSGGGDPCAATVASSLRSDYESYGSEVSSWYSDNSADVSSALSQCSQLTQYASLLPVCVTALFGDIAGGGGGGANGTSASDMSSMSTSMSMTGSMTSDASATTGTDMSMSTGGTDSAGTATTGGSGGGGGAGGSSGDSTDTATGADASATDDGGSGAPQEKGYAMAALAMAGAVAVAVL